jgi:hypothetical protein
VADDALVPNAVLDELHQPCVVDRIVGSYILMPPSSTHAT